jgi:signal transduction histidine kinase
LKGCWILQPLNGMNLSITKVLVGLNELAGEAAHTIHLLVEEKEGTLKVELNAEADNILADKMHITNAIVNLLTNAVKYSQLAPAITLRPLTVGRRYFSKWRTMVLAYPTNTNVSFLISITGFQPVIYII